MKSTSSPSPEPHPISMSIVIIVADGRKGTRFFEAGRVQSFAAIPEALASLPGHLNSLVRDVGGDAQLELNKFLKLLAEPEPAVEEPPPAPACPGPSMCVAPEPETPVAEVPSVPAQNPEGLADDYLLALDVTLLGTLP